MAPVPCWPWNLSTVPTRARRPRRRSTARSMAATWALYGATTTMSPAVSGRTAPSRAGLLRRVGVVARMLDRQPAQPHPPFDRLPRRRWVGAQPPVVEGLRDVRVDLRVQAEGAVEEEAG